MKGQGAWKLPYSIADDAGWQPVRTGGNQEPDHRKTYIMGQLAEASKRGG